MTREDILKEVLSLKGSNWLLELATGTGKSRLALEKVKLLGGKKLLLVHHRTVHKKNWENEIKEWWPDCKMEIQFTTYVSLPKHAGSWDCAIFDECHHLSTRCREALCSFDIKHSVLLSATVGSNMKDELTEVFEDLTFYKMDLRDVIEESILPDPRVYLLPLELETGAPTESIWKNKGAKGKTIECNWAERWSFIKQNKVPVRIFCNQRQYLSELNSQIDFWKRKYMSTRNSSIQTRWLRLCGERLKWLSDKKVGVVYKILSHLHNCRTLTFCNSVEQTKLLGEYCINSKNSKSAQNLDDFNNGKIDHITACNMLNECTNLVNCQVGIYNNLNSSDTIIKQRMGRLLRHPNPVIVVPYYINSREEEIVRKMLENYNKDLVKVINNIEEIVI